MVGNFSALLLLSVLVHVYSLGLNISDQVRAGTAPVRGRDTAQYMLHEGGGLPAAYARDWLTLLRHSPRLWSVVLIRERWILANQIRATGWSHRQWIFKHLSCILFYCQMIMTILANITKKLRTFIPISWIFSEIISIQCHHQISFEYLMD